MGEAEILTPRGLTLRGTFVNPVDSGDAAVIFSHSLFSDRQSGLFFTRLAALYRKLGYATLIFDYSGHGQSEDADITIDSQVEDLRAASGWLRDAGFPRQLLHAHSFGTLTALRARPRDVKAMVLTNPITGPLAFDWEQIFSPEQLEELERRGFTHVPDDSPSARDAFRITGETLTGISLNQPKDLVDGLEFPVLLIHDVEAEQQGLLQLTTDVFSRFPDGSRIEALHGADSASANLERLGALATAWAQQHLPVRR